MLPSRIHSWSKYNYPRQWIQPQISTRMFVHYCYKLRQIIVPRRWSQSVFTTRSCMLEANCHSAYQLVTGMQYCHVIMSASEGIHISAVGFTLNGFLLANCFELYQMFMLTWIYRTLMCRPEVAQVSYIWNSIPTGSSVLSRSSLSVRIRNRVLLTVAEIFGLCLFLRFLVIIKQCVVFSMCVKMSMLYVFSV